MEIFTYGGGDFYRMVFNGIASIFGSGDYMMALKISALIGVVAFALHAAFSGREWQWSWFISFIAIFMALLVPKTDLIITDRIVPANSSVVANVPIGVSLPATVFSKFEDWTTRTFETVFSLPSETTYHGNGLAMAQTLVESSTKFEITDPRLRTNMAEFWKSCVYYDVLLGLYSWKDVVNSTNLRTFFSSKTSVARGFTYEKTDNTRVILTCRTGYTNNLVNDLDAEVTAATNHYAMTLYPEESSVASAVLRYSAAMPAAYQWMTGAAMSNSQIILQNAMANSLARGATSFASEADAPAAAEDFALARAEQERRISFTAMGKIAKKLLPVLKNVVTAALFALAPVIFLMAMLPVGPKVLGSYALMLFWLSMWAPLYVILHFAMMYYSQASGGAATMTGLNVTSHTALGGIMSDHAMIAGYLSVSIPMIAWMLVSRSGAMAASLLGRVMGGYEAPLSKSADAAAAGNISLGNTAFMNQSGFQTSTSPSMNAGMIAQYDPQSGALLTSVSGGPGQYVQSPQSSGPLTMQLAGSIKEQASNAYEQATTYVDTSRSQLANAYSNEVRTAAQHNERWSHSEGSGTSHSGSTGARVDQAAGNLDNMVRRFAQEHGLSVTDTKSGDAKVGGHYVIAGASVGIGFDQKDAAGFKEAVDFANSQEFRAAQSQYLAATKERSERIGDEEARAYSRDAAAAQGEVNSATLSHDNAIARMESAKTALARAEETVANFSQAQLDRFLAFTGMGPATFARLMGEVNAGRADSQAELSRLVSDYVSSFAPAPAIRSQEDVYRDGNAAVHDHFDGNKGMVQLQGEANIDGVNAAPRREVEDRLSGQEQRTETIQNFIDTTRETVSGAQDRVLDSGGEVERDVKAMQLADNITGVPGVTKQLVDEEKEARLERIAGELGVTEKYHKAKGDQ